MAQFMMIHADNPQQRLLNQAAAILRNGGVIVYPTDVGYALGCHLNDRKAKERIMRIRDLDQDHNFSILCRDLSELSRWAKVTNTDYRMLKRSLPGPYTFVLRATAEVPRKLLHPKRKTIGVRVPDNQICLMLLEALGEPMMTTSLKLPELDSPLFDAEDVRRILDKHVDLIIDGGYMVPVKTSIIDLSGENPEVLRDGAGSISEFI